MWDFLAKTEQQAIKEAAVAVYGTYLEAVGSRH
jgi:hypothetical protein